MDSARRRETDERNAAADRAHRANRVGEAAAAAPTTTTTKTTTTLGDKRTTASSSSSSSSSSSFPPSPPQQPSMYIPLAAAGVIQAGLYKLKSR
jgi:hypothetical protein